MRKPLAYLDDDDKTAFLAFVRSEHNGHCGTCKYFDQHEDPVWPTGSLMNAIEETSGKLVEVSDANWEGKCRRYPPLPCDDDGFFFGFPWVSFDDWCGEWVAIEPPNES